MSTQGFADDYIDVAQRIADFYAKYPDGRLTTEIVEFTDKRVTVIARAYRTPDDPMPCTGSSYLALPGTTSFTRGSELENAETSAVGRAIVMAGLPSKHVASRDERDAKAGPAPRRSVPQQPVTATETPVTPASAPVVVHHGWNEGDVHADGHRPLRARQSGHLFCPTKLPDGRWCSFDAGSAPRETAAKAATPPPAEEVGPAQDDLCGAASVYQDGTTCNLLRGHAGPSHRVLDDAGKAVSSWPVAA